ncbi:MAG: ferrous iron transport protein B [Bacteroidales bacterium]|nr:ferrous iron transport protein B [Bacteroidales bacterium]
MKYKINSSKLDRILTHRFWGLLIFIAVIWIMFFCTFKIGSYPQQWIEILMGKISIITENSIKSEWLSDFIQNGIINGIGSVLTFLPNILILFFFISLLQETEYLPRAARLMDKYMHGIGLHGSSFIPLLMGFGCNVPAIMATRTIERKNDRILTIMMIPYIPCSARIPTFILFSGIFFPENSILVMMLLYLGGLLTGVVMALINKRLFFNEKKEDYVIELPELRAPSLHKTLKSMWDAAAEYLKKIGTIVLVAVIIIWALDYFPLKSKDNVDSERMSYLQQFGHTIEPAMKPLGFDWKMSTSLITGITAKEFIVSTLGVLYKEDEHLVSEAPPLSLRIKQETYTYGDKIGEKVFNKANALSFMIFALLYIPCVATALTIRKESGSWKWSILSICTTLLIAWVLGFAAYRVGLLLWN